MPNVVHNSGRDGVEHVLTYGNRVPLAVWLRPTKIGEPLSVKKNSPSSVPGVSWFGSNPPAVIMWYKITSGI